MSGKSISNGTLSLRFMQNAAHRKEKQSGKVEAEQAKVQDDGEWEVAKEVREAWGIESSVSPPTQSVTYETSYLPFLFPSVPETTPEASTSSHVVNPKGRRAFNKRGEEIVAEDTVIPSPSPSQPVLLDQSKDLKRIMAISGSPSKSVKKMKDPSKSARNIIRDNTGVGTDLRPPPPMLVPAKANLPGTAFLKPSGVDAPAAGMVQDRELDGDDIVRSARGKTQKRERAESGTVLTEAEGKKRKKKRPTLE